MSEKRDVTDQGNSSIIPDHVALTPVAPLAGDPPFIFISGRNQSPDNKYNVTKRNETIKQTTWRPAELHHPNYANDQVQHVKSVADESCAAMVSNPNAKPAFNQGLNVCLSSIMFSEVQRRDM